MAHWKNTSRIFDSELDSEYDNIRWRYLYPVNWYHSKETYTMRHKPVGYLNQSTTIVVTIVLDMTQDKFYLSITIMTKVSLFGNLIYSTGDAQCLQRASLEKLPA